MRVREMCTKFSQKTWSEERPFWRTLTKWILKELDMKVWIFIWLTLGMSLLKALIDRILNIEVWYEAGFFFTSQQSTYSWVGPCSIELLVVRSIIRQMCVNRIPLGLTMKLLCTVTNYIYYVFGHYPSSWLYLKNVLFIFQNSISETRFCLHLQVKPTQLGPVDGASS
jgi:hypothetical protein